MKMAGFAGFSESEFWQTTPRYFFNYLEGVNRREQLAWERARMVSFWAVQPLAAHVRKGAWQFNKPTDLVEFEWEKRDFKIPELPAEEIARIDKIQAEFFAETDTSQTQPIQNE